MNPRKKRMDDQKASVGDPLLKFADIKTDDVKAMHDLVNKTGVLSLRKSIRYYPFRFFAEGVQAYIYSFHNAVIYYTGTAVEIGLLIRLKPLIEQARQARPSFTPNFKWLVGHSESLLGHELKVLADKLRIMRNCYAHYEIIVAHTAWMDQVGFPQTVERVKAEFRDNRKVIKAVELLKKLADKQSQQTGMLTIRFDFLESNREMMPFIQSRYDDYLAWLPKVWPVKKHCMQLKEFRALYGIETFDSLSSIEWSFEILKALHFL